MIIEDFLINPQYGVGFPTGSIDATTLFSNQISSTVTITIASPGVVTWAGSSLANGQQIVLSTTGTFPTGLFNGTVYYIVNVSGSTFNLSATLGGAAINTSGSQSGTHTAFSSDSSYQTYCKAAYLAMSPALTNQDSANSILTRWLKLTNSAAVWSGGKLKFIPYGDTVVGPTPNQNISNGVVFAPNVTPIYALGDDHFINESGQDPVQIERSDPYASFNWQRIQINMRVNAWLPISSGSTIPWTYWQIENSYVPWPIDVWDQNAIDLYGLRMGSDIQADEICDPSVRQIITSSSSRLSTACLSRWIW